MDEHSARGRLTQLWDEHHRAVVSFARRRMPTDAVDDVVSETFLVAWRRLEDVPVDARGWLLGVTRNVIATHTRTYGRWRAVAVKVALEPQVHAGAAEDHTIELMRLTQAWQRLTHGEREVLALTLWDGLSGQEAADVLGCRRSTYSVRLSRARRHFLDLLRDEPEPRTNPATPLYHPRSTP